MGRHGGALRLRASPVLLAVLAVPVVLAVGVWWFWPTGAASSDTDEAALPCTTPVQVPVTTTAAMRDAVEAVSVTLGPEVCANYTVTAEPSAVTAARLEAGAGDLPQVWLPDSPVLAEQTARRVDGLTVGDPVASTPVVIAVPSGLEAPDPATWGSTIVSAETRLPDPNSSTVGNIALMVGLGEIDGLPASRRTEALAGVGGMLSRVVPEESLLVAHAGQTDAAIFPTTEQQVHRAAVDGLRIVPAESTTPPLQYPLVTTADAPPGPVAALADALAGTEGRQILRSTGFRTPSDPSPVVEGGPSAEDLAVTPSPEDVAAAQQMWAAIARPTRLLNIIDTSGSMRLPATKGGASRIEVAATASTGANRLLADHNAVGLWTFSTEQRGSRDWTDVQPVAPLGEGDHRSALAFALGSLPTRLGGDTGLYDTLDAGYAAMLEDYDPEAVNLMVLFTDGVNDDPAGGLTLAELRSRLSKAADPKKPVTVLLIGMGGVDAKALDPVAAAIPRGAGGGAAVFTISKPQDIADVYVTMLLRRLPT